MRIVGMYPFNDPKRIVETRYEKELIEIQAAVSSINASDHHDKISKEKTMPGQVLYSPVSLNAAFHKVLFEMGWANKRVKCDYPTQYYVDGYNPPQLNKGAFRDMDFVKNKVGVEVQFGKYSFMVYNVAAKMTIFKNLGIIDVGIEIVPVKELANEMSSGVSYFEQFLWDLENRGTSNIDIPVLVLGIAP
jgi:hypothetical protein